MIMEKRIKQLCNKLIVLGYSPFQIRRILQDTVGISDMKELTGCEYDLVIDVLEEYEKLGTEYISVYSK